MSGSVTKTADVADYRRFLRLGAIIALRELSYFRCTWRRSVRRINWSSGRCMSLWRLHSFSSRSPSCVRGESAVRPLTMRMKRAESRARRVTSR